MRISAKGRYALASMVYLSDQFNSKEYIAILNISEALGISKIYLEQVFSILKKSGLVTSTKGSQGGYQLSKPPEEIKIYDILSSTETILFEETGSVNSEKTANMESAFQSMIIKPLDHTVRLFLEGITLWDLSEESRKNNDNDYIFYI